VVASSPLRDRVKTVGRHAVLLIYTGISLFPIYWIFTMSLKTGNQAVAMPPRFIFTPSVANYATLLQQNEFLDAVFNSVVSVTASVALVLAIGVPAAYALSRYDFPRERDVLIWILSTRMLPPVAVVIPFFILFRRFNLYDSIPGLTLMYITINISIVVWVMKAIFDNIPPSLEEAAMIDGATRIQAFLRVVLPSAKSGILASAVISFIFAWIDLLFALVLTTDKAATAPLEVYSFIGSRQIEWGLLAASSTAVFIPVLVFIVAMNRYLARGLSFGIAGEQQ
jgi:multiple sugar transport system permease protein